MPCHWRSGCGRMKRSLFVIDERLSYLGIFASRAGRSSSRVWHVMFICLQLKAACSLASVSSGAFSRGSRGQATLGPARARGSSTKSHQISDQKLVMVLSFISNLRLISPQNFAHVTTAMLSLHVQHFVVILYTFPVMIWCWVSIKLWFFY